MDIPSKKSLGINGEHTALGREFSMHEFKGYMVAKVDSIEKRLDKKDERDEKIDNRLKSLETFKTYAIGIVIGGTALLNVAWELLKARFF